MRVKLPKFPDWDKFLKGEVSSETVLYVQKILVWQDEMTTKIQKLFEENKKYLIENLCVGCKCSDCSENCSAYLKLRNVLRAVRK